jgi:hypothetical protein
MPANSAPCPITLGHIDESPSVVCLLTGHGLTYQAPRVEREPESAADGAELVSDLVLLDPEQFIDTATYDDPEQVPTGVERVFVAGRTVWAGSGHTGELPGGVVREPLTRATD